MDLDGSTLYIFVYDSNNNVISSFSAANSVSSSDVGEYSFASSSVIIPAEPTNRVFMYVECTGGKYVILVDKNENSPQFATVSAISETLGYQSFANGNTNSQFEAWSTHGLPIGPAAPYIKVTTTTPVPNAGILIQ